MSSENSKGRWLAIYEEHRTLFWIGQAVVMLIIGFALAWSLKGIGSQSSAVDERTAPAPGSQIWTCSMHPQIRRDQPGNCPLCGMKLVPVKSSPGGMRTITISPTARKMINIQTSPVERRYVTADIRMVGKVEYDETKVAHITAWVPGRLDRLYVDYPGIEVKKGHHLVYIYSEQLYSAQEELLLALKNRSNKPRRTTTLIQPIDLVASAREKLRLLGLTREQIEAIERRGTPSDHMTIYSPIAGVVLEKLREKGDRVRTGDRIYTVADLNQVWVKLDAYESDIAWLRYGQKVEFTTEAYPGRTFKGQVAFIDRFLDKDTRTAKVRVNVANKDGLLKPEMFVRATVRSQIASQGRVLEASLAGKWISPMHPEIIKDGPGDCDRCGMPLVRAEALGYVTATPDEQSKPLVIPVSSALVTGTRAIVYVEDAKASQPTFTGREVVLGPRAGDYYLVKSGVKQGELVVTNGNFKLDSALQISAKPSMMTPEGGGGGGHDHSGHDGRKTSGNNKTMNVPDAFVAQIRAVVAAHDKITAAVERAELKSIQSSFVALGKAIAKVDSTVLDGHPKSLWTEFAMLLRNDAVAGSEVSSLKVADELYLTHKRNVIRLREIFGLVRATPGHAVVAHVASPEFRQQLRRLLNTYFTVHGALAADNPQLTNSTASALIPILRKLSPSQLKGAAKEFWTREVSNLSKITAQLVAAADIKSQRSAFALLSDEMLVIVNTFSLSNQNKIFELHCPMAFEGRGATWLQTSDEVRNPFYGATHLKCANRVKQLGTTVSKSKPVPTHQH